MIDPRLQAALRNRRWFHYSLLLLALLLALMTAALGVVYALWPEHRPPAATAVAVPTPQPVEGSPRVRGGGVLVAAPTPQPAVGSGVAPVVVAASLQPSAAATSFVGATPRLYCMVNLPNLPLATPITFKWTSLPSGNGIFAYTGTYSSSFKYVYLEGPFPPGQDRCSVYAPAHGTPRLIGSATFTILG